MLFAIVLVISGTGISIGTIITVTDRMLKMNPPPGYFNILMFLTPLIACLLMYWYSTYQFIRHRPNLEQNLPVEEDADWEI